MSLNVKRAARYNARAPRDASSIVTALLLPDDREIFVTVRNMSKGGFMAIADEELQVGTWLGVELPGRGIVQAQIRWSEGGMLGAQFRQPLRVQPIVDSRET